MTPAAGYEEMRRRIVEAILVVVPDAPANVADLLEGARLALTA